MLKRHRTVNGRKGAKNSVEAVDLLTATLVERRSTQLLTTEQMKFDEHYTVNNIIKRINARHFSSSLISDWYPNYQAFADPLHH